MVFSTNQPWGFIQLNQRFNSTFMVIQGVILLIILIKMYGMVWLSKTVV